MAGVIRLILGDQLSHDMSSLAGINPKEDVILMCEVWDEATYVKHHKKKIAFLFSAMRHFAAELTARGYNVHYVKLEDPQNTHSFKAELARACARHQISRVTVTYPGEYRVWQDMTTWAQDLNINVDIREDTRFLCHMDDFAAWAKDRKSLRMEFFYREMRRKYNILLTSQGDPEGGEWNYDSENRKFPALKEPIPAPDSFAPDEVTQGVLDLVRQKFPDHFGDLEPFYFAVTRDQALQVLDHFIARRLKNFGDFQDAMLTGEPWMYHSHISFYLNCGLLSPLEVIQKAEQAYRQSAVPLNAAEGFIRQVLGWREYIRGIYWLYMPEYKAENYLGATRKLPSFFWTGDTKMNCLKQCIAETKQNAYAHHIQRLMVLGNFLLLAGVHPDDVNEWYLIVYADAYEWVELPNVSGMILFADGGKLASKPYAAGGAYINKMSDYCRGCQYDVDEKTGAKACPFNYLYWDFFIRHREKLSNNPRVGMSYRTLDKMSPEKVHEIRESARTFLESLKIDAWS